MKETAHRLGVSKAYLYLEVDRGNLKTICFGKRRLVAVADMHAYVASKAEASAAAAGTA